MDEEHVVDCRADSCGDQLLERCRRHLLAQRTVLWGEAWDLHDGPGLERAAVWLAGEIRAVADTDG